MNETRRPGKVLSIESHANPRIKAIKALAQGKRRRETGLFIAEGLKLVTDALEGSWRIDAVIHRADALATPAVAEAAAKARARGADIIAVTGDILAKITRRENPQTVVAVMDQQTTPLDAVSPAPDSVWIALEEVRDPGNLGTILRTADAIGAGGVLLVGATVDPFSIEAVRATMGSLFAVPIVRTSLEAFLAFRRNWPGQVVGTHLSGATDYREVPFRDPVLLVMGREQSGLSDAMAATCDALVRIPMAGRADSLNLAVATGVMLYEVRRKHLTLDPARS